MSDQSPQTGAPTMHASIEPPGVAIGSAIKQQRRALGLSQEALAARCQITRQTVSNWECGKTIPDALALKSLADALGVGAGDLLNTDHREVIDQARATRREFVVACSIVLAVQLVSTFLNALSIFATGSTSHAGDTFAAFRLGVLVVGAVWMTLIARRVHLHSIRQMIDFASLASRTPGSWGDRALRFIARWFWTLWAGSGLATFVLATIISLVAGNAPVGDNLPAAIVGIVIAACPFSIAFTWDFNVQKERRRGTCTRSLRVR